MLERDHSAEEVGEHQKRMQLFPGEEKYLSEIFLPCGPSTVGGNAWVDEVEEEHYFENR